MFMQIDVVNNKTVKTLIMDDFINSETDIKNLENELHSHTPFSEIILFFNKEGCQTPELCQWLKELKKKNSELHNKLVIREGKKVTQLVS